MQDKALKWLLLVIGSVAGVIVYLIWNELRIAPKELPKIKLGPIENPQKVGEQTYLRLRQEIASEWVVFLGYDHKDPRQFEAVRAFIEAANSDGRPFSEIFCESKLLDKPDPSFCTEFQMNNGADSATQNIITDLVTLVRKPRTDAERADTHPQLSIVPQVYSSHLISQNPLSTWEKTFKNKFMAITLAQMAVHPNDIPKLSPPCVGSEKDMSGTLDMACIILRLSRLAARKQWPQGQLLYQLVMSGEKDYLGLLSVK